MDPWENLAISTLGNLSDAALRLGTQYAGVFLSREQFEAQLDAYERMARLQRPATGLPPLAILMVGAVLVLLLARS